MISRLLKTESCVSWHCGLFWKETNISKSEKGGQKHSLLPWDVISGSKWSMSSPSWWETHCPHQSQGGKDRGVSLAERPAPLGLQAWATLLWIVISYTSLAGLGASRESLPPPPILPQEHWDHRLVLLCLTWCEFWRFELRSSRLHADLFLLSYPPALGRGSCCCFSSSQHAKSIHCARAGALHSRLHCLKLSSKEAFPTSSFPYFRLLGGEDSPQRGPREAHSLLFSPLNVLYLSL